MSRSGVPLRLVGPQEERFGTPLLLPPEEFLASARSSPMSAVPLPSGYAAADPVQLRLVFGPDTDYCHAVVYAASVKRARRSGAVVAGMVLVILGIVVLALTALHQVNGNASGRMAAPAKSPAAVTAVQLAASFDPDTGCTRPNSPRFSDRQIVVNGTVSMVDMYAGPRVFLNAGGGTIGIQCRFIHSDPQLMPKLASLHEGSRVAIGGLCQGVSGVDVIVAATQLAATAPNSAP
jgi:hypothetical protein